MFCYTLKKLFLMYILCASLTSTSMPLSSFTSDANLVFLFCNGFIFTSNLSINSGVGEGGAGGANAPPLFRKEGASPPHFLRFVTCSMHVGC